MTKSKVSLVIWDGQLYGKVAPDPALPFDFADAFGDLEKENVDAIAVPDNEDCVTRFCFFQRSHQEHGAESDPGVAHFPEQGILHPTRRKAQLRDHLSVTAASGCIEDNFADLFRGKALFFEKCRDSTGKHFEEAFVYHEPILPGAQVLAAVEPPDIQHLIREGIAGFDTGNDISVPDNKRSGPISIVLVEAVARLSKTAAVRDSDEQAPC